MRKQILQSFYCVPFLFFGRLSNPVVEKTVEAAKTAVAKTNTRKTTKGKRRK